MIDKSLSEHYYAPFRVRGMLRNWHTLLDNPPMPADEPRRYQPDHRWRLEKRIVVRADLKRALAQLEREDPELAQAIVAYYIDGQEIDEIVAATGYSERTVYYRISQGIKRMSTILGWKPLDERRETQREPSQSAMINA